MQTILIELTFSYSNTDRVLVVLSVENTSTTTKAGRKRPNRGSFEISSEKVEDLVAGNSKLTFIVLLIYSSS